MRAAIFAHFDPLDQVDPYVLHLLRCIRSHFDLIYVVSTSNLGLSSVNALQGFADRVVVKENVGYDFMSWRTGFEMLRLKACTEVVFLNDSVYGPLYNLAPFFARRRYDSSDLWGCTINHQFGRHVQSYYMAFGRNLLLSGFAVDFWRTVCTQPDKMQIIQKYEAGLSRKVVEAGFSIGAMYEVAIGADEDSKRRVVRDNQFDENENSRDLVASIMSDPMPNPVQLFWGEAIRAGVPFLKAELFKQNPARANQKAILNTVDNMKWYDTRLIKNHVQRTFTNG